MAEVIPVENNEPTTKKRAQRGKYLPMEDLILVREVAALRAHVAPYGTVRQTYKQVAAKVNLNPHMEQKVTWKAVQDRYNRLKDDFQVEDRRNAGLSGVAGGEMGDLYQLLSQMQEETQSFVDDRGKDRLEKQKKEQEKERLGKAVVEMALLRRSQRTSSEDGTEDERDDGDGTASGEEERAKKRTKKRRKTQHYGVSGGLSVFAEKLKDADMARINLETEQLKFEKEKWAGEKEERETERIERRKEREDSQKIELQKFELMLDVLRNKN